MNAPVSNTEVRDLGFNSSGVLGPDVYAPPTARRTQFQGELLLGEVDTWPPVLFCVLPDVRFQGPPSSLRCELFMETLFKISMKSR